MAIKSKADLRVDITAAIHANATGAITPAVHHALLTDIIDSSAAGAGSPARDRLKWHPADGWVPVSDTQVQYLVVTRLDTFATLQAALVALLTAGGNEGAYPGVPAFVSTRLSSYASIGGANTSGNDALLSDLWPLGATAPFVWLLTPSPFDLLGRSRANISTRQDNAATNTILESMVSFGRLPYTVDVNGAAYEVGRYRTMLDRPVDDPATPDEAAFRVQYRYAPAPAGVPTVTQVVP